MATSTATYIADGNQPFRPFYYLKVTGLPYYFFATVNPTSSAYGSDAWTLPTGYTAKQGFQIPDDQLTQSLPDMLGGIASAERCRFEMVDFDATDSSGRHSFFGKLLAPGRITTSTSAAVGQLSSDIDATDDTGDTFTVAGTATNAFSTGFVYVGSETIKVTSAPSYSAPNWTITINARNQFPCSSVYPYAQYHRVTKNSDGQLLSQGSIIVTQEPLTIIGRTCALYIGHMRPDGKPEPEAQTLMRFVGRITAVNYGRDPGMYEFQAESIMGELAASRVAPGLAHGEIKNGYYLDPVGWRSLQISVAVGADPDDTTTFPATGGSKRIEIDDGSTNYYASFLDLIVAIKAQLTANPITLDIAGSSVTVTFDIWATSDDQGKGFIEFWVTRTATPDGAQDWTFKIGHAWSGAASAPGSIRSGGLLAVLGFDAQELVGVRGKSSGFGVEIAAGAPNNAADTEVFSVRGNRPHAGIFFPTSDMDGAAGTSITMFLTDTQDANGDRFFETQGQTYEAGLVRLGNGTMMQVTAHNTTSLQVKPYSNVTQPDSQFYYVEYGKTASVDQIIAAYHLAANTPEVIFARLLCSTRGVPNDTEYNFFPQGVGLGLNGIVDKDSFRDLSSVFTPRYDFYVDSSTKFGDIWNPMAKESGLFLVWEVETGTISLRHLTQVNQFNLSDFEFSESNREHEKDRSKAALDFSNIRTGWNLKYGWDYAEKKFKGPEITITDEWAVSAYGTATRLESFSDLTIPEYASDIAAQVINNLLGKRANFVRYPWLKVTRSVNKTGLLLAPGTLHTIIDNTIANPFTGQQGIEDGDGVIGWLMAVKHKLEDGSVEVTFLIDQISDASLIRPWSPTGLIDFTAAGNGYSTASSTLTMASHYTADDSDYDGVDFRVGDTCAVIPWDSPIATPTPDYEKTLTISSVSTDGRTIVHTGGSIGALSTTVESILILRPYANATTARKTGDDKVAFQGDGDTLLIDDTAHLHRFG